MVEDSSGEPPPESPELEDVALALEEAADKERVLDNLSYSPDWEKSFDLSVKNFRTWNDLASKLAYLRHPKVLSQVSNFVPVWLEFAPTFKAFHIMPISMKSH